MKIFKSIKKEMRMFEIRDLKKIYLRKKSNSCKKHSFFAYKTKDIDCIEKILYEKCKYSKYKMKCGNIKIDLLIK